MKKLKIIIICISILLLIIISCLILINRNGISEEKEYIEDINEQEQAINILADVQENSKFYTVSACIMQYLDFINENNSMYYGYDENNEYIKIVEPTENILGLLSKKYIEEQEITQNNLEKYINFIDDKQLFVPLEMKVTSNDIIDKYIVYGVVESLDNQHINDLYIIVNLDEKNETFSIEPVSEKIKNIDEINYENNEDSIEENDVNGYDMINVDDEYMAKNYIDIYKKLVLAIPEKAYQFLDEEYRDKRFGTQEEFKNYVQENNDEIYEIQCLKYLVNNYENYTEYVCQDQHENLYIFQETAPMQFRLKLDTYTIPTEKFKNTYKEANVQKRVAMNIDKWNQMLNNRDYKAAYQVLDETFRNNNFPTLEDFEDYIKTYLSSYYKLDYGEFAEENGIYIQEITFKEMDKEETEAVTKKIIMQLNEGTDFVMSFNTFK